MKTLGRSARLRTTECARRISRRRLLRVGGASVAGAALLGVYGCGANTERDEASGGTRSVEHALGKTEVPNDPKRVVALDPFFTLQVAVETGVPVVGSAIFSPEQRFPATLTERETEGIESVGTGFEPDFEKIASLGPDLILSTTFVEPPYDKLSRIAPTVVFGDPFDWKPYVRALGEATGRSEAVGQGLAGYEARVEDLRGRLRDATVSHASLAGNETFDNYLEGPGAFGPFRVLEELGVGRPPAEVTDDEGSFSRTLSLEELPGLAGDVLFYNVGYPGADDASLEEAEGVVGGPLWRKIPAVQNGEAHQVDSDHWEGFGGLRSANLVLDDVEKHLT